MPTISQAFGPAQLRGLTSTAGAIKLTTVYRPPAPSSVEPPPATARLALAVTLLGRAARIVHGVVPERQRQEEDAHEQEQRENLHQQGEQHHGAAAWFPEGQQLRGGTRDVQRDQEEDHHADQEDRRLLRLPVVELTQPGNRGQPGRQARTGTAPGRRQNLDRMGLNHWRAAG